MIKQIFLFLIIISLASAISAQEKIELSGKVPDSNAISVNSLSLSFKNVKFKKTIMNEKNTSGRMNRIIDAWIDIDAKPEEIWEVLLDFKSWGLWNPFIPKVEGNLQIGEHMRIKVVPPGMIPIIFKPEVYEVKTHEKILWGGSFLKILYRGDHAFLLEPISEGKTRFRQIERFNGPMVLFMGSTIKKTEIGYHQMNLALKEQVERSKLAK